MLVMIYEFIVLFLLWFWNERENVDNSVMFWVPTMELHKIVRSLELKEWWIANQCFSIRPDSGGRKLLSSILSGNVYSFCCWKDGIRLVWSTIFLQLSFFQLLSGLSMGPGSVSCHLSVSQSAMADYYSHVHDKCAMQKKLQFRRAASWKKIRKLFANWEKTKQKTNLKNLQSHFVSDSNRMLTSHTPFTSLLPQALPPYQKLSDARCRKPKLYQNRFPFKIMHKICMRIFIGLSRDGIDISLVSSHVYILWTSKHHRFYCSVVEWNEAVIMLKNSFATNLPSARLRTQLNFSTVWINK